MVGLGAGRRDLVTAAGGRFLVPEVGAPPRGEWRFPAGAGIVDGLPPGVWTVTAVGPNGEVWQRTVAVAEGAETEVVLE